MPLTEQQLRDQNAALRLALELMGFDSNAVVDRLQGEDERMWREMPLRASTVVFDDCKAASLGLSENGVAGVQTMFAAMRRV
jgi:hypothetical protein